jgi:hypothetical protein
MTMSHPLHPVSWSFVIAIIAAATVATSAQAQTQRQAEEPRRGTPETAYIQACVTAMYALTQQRAGTKDRPRSCEDQRLRVEKPNGVARSLVWIWMGRVAVDVTLADERHVLFDGQQMTVLPKEPAAQAPAPRAMPRCWEWGPVARCCTETGYCCTWFGDGPPTCRPGSPR